jgi:2-polyprenyl-3-methyl-5-hydroxy-6-metoxy-1,4-benzoquinol methylase
LDFGCGTLTVAEEIAQTKSVQVEGVDVINFNTEHLV